MALIFRRRHRREPGPDDEMTLVEHLQELRNRLIISLAALAVGMIGGWLLFEPVFDALSDAFCDYMTDHPQLAFSQESPCKLVYLSPTEPFLLKLKVVAVLGLLLALPVVLYQLWRFITPGLLPKERRYAAPFVLASVLLFALGAWLALIALPRGLNFLLGFGEAERAAIVLSISKYIGFVTFMILAFGVSFEFPVVLTSLTLVGVLSSTTLRRWRRQALLVAAVAAAVITPSADPFTMIALMIPLLVFYELSILIARLFKR
jgi:sec-independent protein translocase protein TatC